MQKSQTTAISQQHAKEKMNKRTRTKTRSLFAKLGDRNAKTNAEMRINRKRRLKHKAPRGIKPHSYIE